MNSCQQKGCKGALYCIESRPLMQYPEGTDKRYDTRIQATQRRWCCAECGARYIGLEVINPQPYKFRPLPKNKLKTLGLL